MKTAMMAPLIFFSMAALAVAENEPAFEYKFEEFAVKEVFKGTPAKPKIKSKGDRLFRTQLRNSASIGPNFAGHYTVASWGCGSDGCTSFSIIDSNTGEILNGVGTTVSRSCKQDWQEKILIYKPDSRLFIINGNLNDEDLGVFYYELKNKKLKLLKSTPHPRERNLVTTMRQRTTTNIQKSKPSTRQFDTARSEKTEQAGQLPSRWPIKLKIWKCYD